MALPDMDLKGVTQEDVSKLAKAMKSKEFRGHMDEYCREVSDPGHRKEYLQYLDQLEAKGEMPEGQQLLRCQPGCCVKTWICFKNGQTQKCFINIVHSDRLEDVSMERSDKGDGHQVKLPCSLSPPRPDRDHKDEYCMTCDFAVSSRTFFQAMQYPNYMKMLVDTAAEGLASHHLKGNEDVKKDYKVMQKLACKGGAPMPMSVKAEFLRDKGAKPTTPKVAPGAPGAVTPSELRQMRKDAQQQRSRQEQREEEEPTPQARPQAPEPAAAAPRIRVPEHRLVHSGNMELADFMESSQITTAKPSIPKSLKLTVEVPTVKRVGDISLEVTSTNVVVEVPDKYYLDLPLPYEVQEEAGAAKFDKAKQVLTLELPVVPKPQTPNPNCSYWRGDEPAPGGDDDGALSEGRGESDEELPALEEEPQQQEEEQSSPPTAQPTAAAAPVAAGPPPSAAGQCPPAAAAGPARQCLELGAGGSSLHIAKPAAETEESPAEALDDRPAFLEAEAFEGARPGYYFGRGDRGLGYHLDRRQPRPRATREVLLPGALGGHQSPSAAPSEPLVAEIADAGTGTVPVAPPASEAPKAEAKAAPPRPPLPPGLPRYVDATTALCAKGGAEGGMLAVEEPAVEWEQTLQNVMLFISIPRGHEVSELQLSLRGQRLLLAFRSRPLAAPGAEPAPWRRWQLRRLLCGLVDLRQWYAESPTEAGEPLAVVVRKVDRGLWAEIFDAKAAVAPEPIESTRDSLAGAAAAVGSSAGAEGSLSLEELDSAAAPLGGEAEGEAEAEALEDSAELDAVAPVTEEAAPAAKLAAEGGAAKGPATEAMIQSAMVMGQGVLMRNRLMYELL